MIKFLKVLGVLALIGILSILLTPFLYSVLPMFKFEKIFNRLVMIFAVAAAVLYVRKKGISLSKCGFDFKADWKRLFAYGFLGGAFMVLAITIVETAWGPRYFRHPIPPMDVIQRFVKGMLSGVTVGIVEEFFFRGFCYGALRRRLNVWLAVLLASLFYSFTHFLDNGQIFIPEHPGFWDAARLFAGYLEPLTFGARNMLPEFAGLFFFGVLLNAAYVKTRTLFASIGLHAGAVFCIKWQNAFLRKGPEVYDTLYGNTPHYDGPAEWLIIIFCILAVLFCVRLEQAVPRR